MTGGGATLVVILQVGWYVHAWLATTPAPIPTAVVMPHSGCGSHGGMPDLLHPPEEHLPPPQPHGRRCGDLSSLFSDSRCADALVAMLTCGFAVCEWRTVWDLRSVSRVALRSVSEHLPICSL